MHTDGNPPFDVSYDCDFGVDGVTRMCKAIRTSTLWPWVYARVFSSVFLYICCCFSILVLTICVYMFKDSSQY